MRLTTFTDPTTLYEVIMVENGLGPACGAVYDPRRTDLPVPWVAGCGHCSRSREVALHVRRCLQALISSKREGDLLVCQVPTNSASVEVSTWQENDALVADVQDPDDGSQTRVVKPADAPMSVADGDRDLIRSSHKILRRCLRFLLSARSTSPAEAVACLSPLAAQKSTRRHVPCQKIDWTAVVKKLREEVPR